MTNLEQAAEGYSQLALSKAELFWLQDLVLSQVQTRIVVDLCKGHLGQAVGKAEANFSGESSQTVSSRWYGETLERVLQLVPHFFVGMDAFSFADGTPGRVMRL